MKRILSILLFLCIGTLPFTLTAAGKTLCVLDFINADTAGLKQFAIPESEALQLPDDAYLSSATTVQHYAVNPLFYSFYATQVSSPAADAYGVILGEKMRRWNNENHLIQRITRGEARTILIGAERLEALLAAQLPGIKLVPRQQFYAALQQLTAEQCATMTTCPQKADGKGDVDNEEKNAECPKKAQADTVACKLDMVECVQKLAKESGVDYIVTSALSDLRSKSTTFSGYGITTETTIFELDFSIVIRELTTGKTICGGVFTGKARVRKQPGMQHLDHNLYQTAFNAALENAVAEFAPKLKALLD